MTLIGTASLAQAPAEGPDAVVARLYRDFAWEAIFASRKGEVTFVAQPRAVLDRYLSPELAALVVADRACVQRTKEICRLDFHPVFASQDPGATDLEVSEADRDNVVTVRFSYPGNAKKIVIRHALVKTERGWRIADMRYAEGHTLKGLLRRPP
jgi:hypothetical protein